MFVNSRGVGAGGGGMMTVEFVLLNVIDYGIVEEIFDRKTTADQATSDRRADLVRHPIGDYRDVALHTPQFILLMVII